MYTFSEARQIVGAQYRNGWRAPDEGTFMVAPWGYEDAKHYVVLVGAREWFMDGDTDYLPPDNDRCIMVRKDTGQVKEINPVLIHDKLDNMTPVGTGGYPDEED